MPYDDDAEFWDPTEATDATADKQQAATTVEETKENGPKVESPEDEGSVEITKAKQSVEYYIHYLEDERPMDRWVKEDMVRINDELVDDLLEDFQKTQEAKKKEREISTFLVHDEHSGMNEDELRNFMNATKLKTVEFI